MASLCRYLWPVVKTREQVTLISNSSKHRTSMSLTMIHSHLIHVPVRRPCKNIKDKLTVAVMRACA